MFAAAMHGNVILVPFQQGYAKLHIFIICVCMNVCIASILSSLISDVLCTSLLQLIVSLYHILH